MGNSPEHTSSDLSTKSVAVGEQMDIAMLGASELHDILSPKLCLAALEEAYANLYESPDDRGQSVEFKTEKGKFHVKSGLSPKTHKYFAAKVNANFPDNPDLYGLPTIQGLIVLCACDNGRPLAVLHSGELTGRRTAAATALAAKHGARSNSRRLAIIGCGAQARYQVAAILDVLPIKEVIAFDKDAKKARAFATWVAETYGIEAKTSSSPGEAVRGSEVCITCTTSTQAIIDSSMVSPGCFIAAVGADNPDKWEIDPEIFAEARIIVDDAKQCSIYGDLAHALDAGAVKAKDVDATLADLAAGAKPGRTSNDEIVIFDSTGVGVQDVAAASAAFEILRRTGGSKKKSR